MKGDKLKIYKWLRPISFIYGIGVGLRNWLFDSGVLKQHSYNIPIISVGNLTVGGTGKTPHTEYLIRLLMNDFNVAVLSRGYKRKSRGYVMATDNTTMEQIGDEPYQMKKKFPKACVAVDANRRNGIAHLKSNELKPAIDVILLDDAYQHRYVKPGINILLVDFNRFITDDELLPAGRLREPVSGKTRANIVVVSKCPSDIKPMDVRILINSLSLYPYQKLYFTTLRYGELSGVFVNKTRKLEVEDNVLILTGIASPETLHKKIRSVTSNVETLIFADHHNFSKEDIQKINSSFAAMAGTRKTIVTTEKDAVRLVMVDGLSEDVKNNIFALPIEVAFLQGGEHSFNEKIVSYVRQNSRNSILAKKKDAKHS